MLIKTKNLKQQIKFKAPPLFIYNILMDSKKHTKLTGSKAVIGQKEGGKFRVYDGSISGENIKLNPGKNITQKWRIDEWPDNHYSLATFKFSAAKEGTLLKFLQTGIPAVFYQDIKQGWIDFYWQPLKKMISKKA
jgi:activator of HSP90 ATPase